MLFEHVLCIMIIYIFVLHLFSQTLALLVVSQMCRPVKSPNDAIQKIEKRLYNPQTTAQKQNKNGFCNTKNTCNVFLVSVLILIGQTLSVPLLEQMICSLESSKMTKTKQFILVGMGFLDCKLSEIKDPHSILNWTPSVRNSLFVIFPVLCLK